MRRTIRKATADDANFVISTMLKCLRHDGPLYWPVKSDIFYPALELQERQMLARPGVEVLVSCDADDPGHIFGYLVYAQPKTVHFLYVKRPMRNFGVATQLLEARGITWEDEHCSFSQFTRWTMRKIKEGSLKWTFNPWLLAK